MRISDWSSDVCSSDLQASKRNAAVAAPQQSLYLLRPIWHRVVRLVSLGNMHLPPTSTEAKHRPELGSAIGCPSHKSALERPDNVPALPHCREGLLDRKSTRLNSSHSCASRMPSS